MPSPTPEQRQAFADALRSSMSRYAPEMVVNGVKMRRDEWLAKEVGLTSQAIRNYLGAKRVPRRLEEIEKLERALSEDPRTLAQHVGFPPPEPRDGWIEFSMIDGSFTNRLLVPLKQEREWEGWRQELLSLMSDALERGTATMQWLGPGEPPEWIALELARFALTNRQFAQAAKGGELTTEQTGTVDKLPATGTFDPDED